MSLERTTMLVFDRASRGTKTQLSAPRREEIGARSEMRKRCETRRYEIQYSRHFSPHFCFRGTVLE